MQAWPNTSVATPKVSVVFPLKGKEAGAGAVDEEDFIKAFEDVPAAQVRISARQMREASSRPDALPCSDLLQQGAGGAADQDQRRPVRRQARLGAPGGSGKDSGRSAEPAPKRRSSVPLWLCS